MGTGSQGADAQSVRYKRDKHLPPDTQRYGSDGFRFWAFEENGRELELDLTRPTVEGLEVLDRLRPPLGIIRS